MNAPEIIPQHPIRFRFAITTWGTALMRCRVDRGFAHKDIADRAGVSKGLVKAWERGEGYPGAQQLKRLYASISTLRRYENLLPREAQAEVDVDRAHGLGPLSPEDSPPPTIQELDEPRTFGDALKLARQVEGLLQEEVGDLLSVDQSTVSSWEREEAIPVQEHYSKLLQLFEVIADAPRPRGMRDIPKPVGNPGGRPSLSPTVLTPAPHAVPVRVSFPTPPPLPGDLPPRPPGRLAPLEEAGVLYARALRELHRARADLEVARARVRELEPETARLEKEAEMAETRVHELAQVRP